VSVAGDKVSVTSPAPSADRNSRVGMPSLVVAQAVLTAAGASGYLGARWAADVLRSELTLRPPVILFDMAGAVQGVDPAQVGASVSRAKERAKRLAEGGFLVLDAQAVVAAPAELYLVSERDAGGMTR